MVRRMRVAALVFLTLVARVCGFIPGADGPVTRQEAVEGGNVTLHCDTSSAVPDDELMLLVWYKNIAPIYSFDARISSEWSNDSFNVSSRLLIDRSRQPTAFTITNLQESDEALYHCRVDFLLTPTRNLGVDLKIIVLPSQPFFLDEVGNKVEDKIGPYHEGDTLVLSCLVIGGRPPPKISWFSGEVLVDESDGASDIPGVKENELFLPLTRENAANLTCRATNTRLSDPIESTLAIELYLPAQNVSISWVEGASEYGSLQAGKPAVAKCSARGSHPAPELSWWLDHKHLTHHSNQSWQNGTATAVSFLQLRPGARDDAATLSCVATNVAMAPSRGSKADVITLNVTYIPTVEVVKIGFGKIDEIIELDTLQLECEVRANPAVDKIEWYFNDTKIMPDGIWGENTSMPSLVVEETTREMAGKYSCAASNSVGATRAQYHTIKVLYPPKCTKRDIELIEENIVCNVEALPTPDTFFWHISVGTESQKLTSGSGVLPLSQINGSLLGSLSVTCEASNGIATQEKPCKKSLSLEHLRPLQPQQCDLAFESEEFQMRCIPVENATYYEVAVWRMSTSNASLILERRGIMGWGNSQALTHNTANQWLVRGSLGILRSGDEAGASACNRFGCSRAMILRPTDNLLKAGAPPWWHFLTEKDVGISVGAVLLVVVFLTSTFATVRLARSRGKTRLVQVLQLDDVAREYLDNLEQKRHAACSVRSCSSGYSGCSLDSVPPAVDRLRKPLYYWDQGPQPDVTLTLHRESAV